MSNLSLDSLVKRNPDLVYTDMDGEIVMLDIENGEYIGINVVGSRVWELLEQPLSIRVLGQAIYKEFDVDEAQCQQDMLEFVGEMLEKKLVQACE